jgi:hypothetical protein
MANNNISWIGNKVVDSGMLQQQQYGQTPAMSQRMANDRYAQPLIPAEGGMATYPMTPGVASMPSMPITQQGPPPIMDRSYIPGYLAENIGKNVRAEFVIGTNQYVDKTGRLYEVGTNYFVLEDVNSRTHTMCDLYSVKFVTLLV